MGKAIGVLILILAIAAGIVLGVPAVRARVLGVPLKMQFVAGTETRLKTTFEGKFKIEASGLPDTLLPKEAQAVLNTDIPFHIEERARYLVKSVSGDVADVEITDDGGSVEVTLPKQPIKYSFPGNGSSVVKMDVLQGRARLDTPAGATADESKKIQDFVNNLSLGFVPGEVKRVGQSWSHDDTIPLSHDSWKCTITSSTTNTFESVDKKNNFTVADIAGKQDIKIDLSLSHPMGELKLNGGIQGSSHGYFDWVAGQIVGSDSTQKLDLTLYVKADKPQPIDAKAHLTGDVKVTLERL